jgi:hypothetical protein
MRWKGYYGRPSFSAEELAQAYTANEVPYTCLKSGQPWGPDDDVCAPERCGAGRTCFEVSPKLVRSIA